MALNPWSLEGLQLAYHHQWMFIIFSPAEEFVYDRCFEWVDEFHIKKKKSLIDKDIDVIP